MEWRTTSTPIGLRKRCCWCKQIQENGHTKNCLLASAIEKVVEMQKDLAEDEKRVKELEKGIDDFLYTEPF